MTDNAGGTPPYTIPGFSGFGDANMMGKMWELMRLNPFLSMASGGQGANPSLSMMSDMLAPLTNIEELDKRVTDMRAVEQWLKLNLNMLQSAIQALEVQRATLATLRAFGAFAQTSVENAHHAATEKAKAASGWPMGGAAKQDAPREETGAQASASDAPAGSDDAQNGAQSAPPPGFDPTGWWNVLQSQFNQLAHLAMIQPGMTGPLNAAGATDDQAAAPNAQSADPEAEGGEEKPEAAAKKAPARKAAPRKKPA